MSDHATSLGVQPDDESILSADVDDVAYLLLKRAIDVLLSLIALLIVFPLFVLIPVLIITDSPGWPLFVQERIGSRWRLRNRRVVWELRTFKVFKFRSMVKDADSTIHAEYCRAFVDGRVDVSRVGDAPYKLNDDARITRVGRLLRRSSLDELPQLFNVLRGDMSLVGPRPVPCYEATQYQPWHFERLASLPGITGLWQVKGRGRVPFSEMMDLDIEYVRSRSVVLDCKILWHTLPAVIRGHGAA